MNLMVLFVTGSITHNEGPEYSKKLLVLTKLSTSFCVKDKSTTRTLCYRRFTYLSEHYKTLDFCTFVFWYYNKED